MDSEQFVKSLLIMTSVHALNNMTCAEFMATMRDMSHEFLIESEQTLREFSRHTQQLISERAS